MEKADRFLSRRKLLFAAGAATSVAAVAAVRPVRAVLARNVRALAWRQPMLREMFLSLANGSYDEWLGEVGTIFSLGGGTTMRLAGVQPFAMAGSRPVVLARGSAFLVVFDLLDGQTMAGDLIYTAHHPQYGPLQIFLSASSDPRTPGRMTAVFN